MITDDLRLRFRRLREEFLTCSLEQLAGSLGLRVGSTKNPSPVFLQVGELWDRFLCPALHQ